jgi:hypothetical protein
MKKLLVVLLSLGLIAAFAATASAATSIAKFSGTYYVGGIYENNAALVEDAKRNSTAKFHQRYRMQVDFKVDEGLSFSTRFDAMEKGWGDTRWSGANAQSASEPAGDTNSSRRVDPSVSTSTANTTVTNRNLKIQENIEFEYSYITFKTAFGQFDVGYQDCDGWGTWFSNASNSRPAIRFMSVAGPVTYGFKYEKWYESTNSNENNGKVDADFDIYGLFGIYKFKSGDVGLLYRYIYNAAASTIATTPFKSKVHQVAPYFRATFGPIYTEGEVNYLFGKAAEWTTAAKPAGITGDIDAKTLTAYIAAQYNMGPAFFGARYGYASGNDPNDPHSQKQILGQNTSYQPLLIMGGGERILWQDGTKLGGLKGAAGAAGSVDDKKFNWISYTLYGGYKVTPKFEIGANLGYVTVAEKPMNYVDDVMGTEFDVNLTYKIYDNLSYWVGAGYMWSGDYWKGTNAANKVEDNYILVNRLQLMF